jgi:hypothetical protein
MMSKDTGTVQQNLLNRRHAPVTGTAVLATFIIWLKNEQCLPSEYLIFRVDDER